MSALAWLLLVFVVLLILDVPVAYAVACASLAGYVALEQTEFPPRSPMALVNDMVNGVGKLSLIAIPFFIFAGNLMGQGGIADRLVAFSRAALGWLPGGLSYVSVGSSMLFGGVSGSAVADASSVGSIMIPAMTRAGYPREFSASVTVSASTLGLIIPPSNTMILYAAITAGLTRPAGFADVASPAYLGVDCSATTMFLCGFIPGALTAVALMAVCALTAWKRGFPRESFAGARALARAFIQAMPAAGLLLLIMSGILLGWFDAEQSAAVAVIYGLVIALLVYREIGLRQTAAIVRETAVTTGVVFMLIAASMAMKNVLVATDVVDDLKDWCLSVSSNRFAFLLALNVLLLIVGTFLDMTPAMLIFTPMFLPVAMEYGIHPAHFGMVLLVNLCIGLCTPPVGNCLFVGCTVAKVPISRVVRPMLPFYAAMIMVLLVVTYFEDVSLWLPAHVRASPAAR
ncbi:MAG: TRAP transporter large permease [Planctomycetes bacterium]|nr:TRAP transporter large permease [Planctomycetota bacterium]